MFRRHWLLSLPLLLALVGMLDRSLTVCRATTNTTTTTTLHQAIEQQESSSSSSSTGLFAACPCWGSDSYLNQETVAVDSSSTTQTLWHVCLVVYHQNDDDENDPNNPVVLLGVQNLALEYKHQEQEGAPSVSVWLVQDSDVTCLDNHCVVQGTLQDKQERKFVGDDSLLEEDQDDFSRNDATIVMTGNVTIMHDDAVSGTMETTRQTTAFSVPLLGNTSNTTNDACPHQQREQEESSVDDVLVVKGLGMVIFILVAVVIICCCIGTKIQSTTTATATTTTSDIQVV